MSVQPWRGAVLLFDLFGTVVHFAPRVPTVEVAGTRWRSTMGWLREAVAAEAPEVPFDDLLAALMWVTEDIVRQRPPDYFEVPSRERFRRALTMLGIAAGRAAPIAERLSGVHMRHLAAQTVLPAGHASLLQRLGDRYRLGLVSNFDHAATAQRILVAHGVARYFETILISETFGRRKPHPAIFAAALQQMGAGQRDALFIGDSASDDVAGAHNAGLAVVWVNVKQEALPEGTPTPDYVIDSLEELSDVLA
jgi:HAD superfamily hydrolase (TIGR01549 family)